MHRGSAPSSRQSLLTVGLECRMSAAHSIAGRIGAEELHSRYDSKKLTANARRAFLDRFERQVDPDRVLDPRERSRRAEHAKRAYFLRLAKASAKARSSRAQPRRT